MRLVVRRVSAASPLLRAQAWTRRSYAFQASGAPIFEVFNRRTKWLQKERAAADVESSRQSDYLKDEVAIRLCERLLVYQDVKASIYCFNLLKYLSGYQTRLSQSIGSRRKLWEYRESIDPREPGP